MAWKLFIDDERYPISDDWVIARSSEEAINLCKELGLPNYISFDHDLGGEDTSIKFINWMIDHIMDNGEFHNFPRDYFVHSQNPVGVKNIYSLMVSFIQHIDKN